MRDGKKLETPFESTGREIFENGYQFRLNFISPDNGYFYLFDEGKDSSGKVNCNILYPIPLSGKETAASSAEKIIQTDWNTFGATAETENIWLIWTKNEQVVLNEAATNAFKNQGKVSDLDKQSALQHFLADNGKQKPNTEIDKDNMKSELF